MNQSIEQLISQKEQEIKELKDQLEKDAEENNSDIFNFGLFTKRLHLKKKTLYKSGREAAKDIGISAATYSRIERGRLPDLITYAKCCKWLNLELDFFIK